MNFFTIFFFSTLALKLLLAYHLPLLPDEAYYWLWSHNIQLSYFDHPGMVSWLLNLGHFLEPYGHSIRWPAIILCHFNLLIWHYIFEELNIPDSKRKIWYWLSILSPFLGFGSVLVTPDLPVLFFWSLSLLFLIRILSRKNILDYIYLGISLGLGFDSKYHIVLFVLFSAIYLISTKSWIHIRSAGVISTVVFGFLFSLPVFVWNYENNFQSFVFQFKHGLSSEEWKWQWPFEYVLGQYILLLPPLVYFAINAKLKPREKIFSFLTFGPFVFFLFSSFKSSVEMNWTIIAYPTFYAIVSFSNITRFWLKRVYIFLATFNIILIITMFNGIYLHGKIMEPFFFESQKNLVAQYQPLYGINYQTASSLWYFSKQKVLKIPKSSRYDFFDQIDSNTLKFPKSFYIIRELHNEFPLWLFNLKPEVTLIKNLNQTYVLEHIRIK